MIAIILLWLLYILFAFYVLLNHAPSCRLTEQEIEEGRKLQRVTFIESSDTCEESMFGFDLFEKKKPRR